MSPTKDHSRVSPEGRKLGEQMVRMTGPWIEHLAREGEADERCKSCAFRAGTVPNGCIQTQMDVLKAVVEDVPFQCHQADKKGLICHGWFAARYAINQSQKSKGALELSCPWEFSPPDEAATSALRGEGGKG